MIGIELFYLESDNSYSSQTQLKSHSLESINQTNGLKGFSASDEFINNKSHMKSISQNKSTSEFNLINNYNRSDSSNFSGIYINIRKVS